MAGSSVRPAALSIKVNETTMVSIIRSKCLQMLEAINSPLGFSTNVDYAYVDVVKY